MALVPTSKAFTFFQEFEQWVCIVAINLNLLEARKLCTIVELTEVVNRLVSTRSLATKLVAWEVEDFETLLMIFLVELF
jgi:hypothetical protein